MQKSSASDVPTTATKASRRVMMGCLFIVRFGLFVVGENPFELRFQFFYAVRHGNDGAVAVDEE
jgi:hypothetical protein